MSEVYMTRDSVRSYLRENKDAVFSAKTTEGFIKSLMKRVGATAVREGTEWLDYLIAAFLSCTFSAHRIKARDILTEYNRSVPYSGGL